MSAAHRSQAGARLSGDCTLSSVTDDLIKTSRDGEGSQTGSLSTEQPGPQKKKIAQQGKEGQILSKENKSLSYRSTVNLLREVVIITVMRSAGKR